MSEPRSLREVVCAALGALARDIHLGVDLWARVRKIECRFRLVGYTIQQVCYLDRSAQIAAVRKKLAYQDRRPELAIEQGDAWHYRRALRRELGRLERVV